MFEIKEDFYYKKKPVKIISGAIHYFRVVPEYWKDRLEKLKAMGCNTVETYIPWNMHEPKEGTFDFKDRLDIRRFIEIASDLGLFVIVRPSPYICAEWEFGGLPSWLIKDRNMKLRTAYQPYLEKVSSYYKRLFQELVPLQCTNGGPIIMMQIENEYGSYGNDKAYLNALTDMMEKYGVDVPLVTSDGTWLDMLDNGTIPERAFPTVNFGSDSRSHFNRLNDFLGKPGPLMVMEFWNGWFTAWGDDHYQHTEIESSAKELDNILSMGHVNFYMFHGGTHFGFSSGSNYYENLSPDITSYDYDAPLTEWGEVTEKYKAFRSVIEKYVEHKLPDFPKPVERKAYGVVSLLDKTSLFSNLTQLSKPVNSPFPLSMEDLDQSTGYVLYRGNLGKKRDISEFRLLKTSDRAQVYVNGKHLFTQYDKELGNKESFQLTENENKMDILVENMGRINYGERILHQQKGITDGVYVNGALHSDWTHYSLPLQNIESINFEAPHIENQPGFYRFELNVIKANDTFVDMSGCGKGVVFLNGFNLGRFWDIGPQFKLYVPAPLLKQGTNEIIVFETEGKVQEQITFTDQPPY